MSNKKVGRPLKPDHLKAIKQSYTLKPDLHKMLREDPRPASHIIDEAVRDYFTNRNTAQKTTANNETS